MSGSSWSNQATTSLTLPTGAIAPEEGLYLNGASDTILVYSAAGALIASVAASAGSDGLGNSYPAGISATSGVISQSIILLYNGTPAAGNLIGALAAAAGTDSFGNTYAAGLSLGVSTMPQLLLQPMAQGAELLLPTNNAGELHAGTIFSEAFTGVAGNTLLQLTGPSAAARADLYKMVFSGSTFDGTTAPADFTITYVDSGGTAHPILTLTSGATVQSSGTGATPLTVAVPTGQTAHPFTVTANGTTRYWVDASGDIGQDGYTVRTTGGTPDVWQFIGGNGPAYAAHWSAATSFDGFGGGTNPGLKVRLKSEDEVELYGLATAATSATTTVTTLASGYYNPTSTIFGYALRDSGGTISTVPVAISTAGMVLVSPTPVNGDTYLFNLTGPLGNLS